MNYLELYEGETLLGSWSTADEGISIETYATCKDWHVSYIFEDAGEHYLWYKATADGVTEEIPYGDTEEVIVPPACDHSDTSRVQIGQTYYNQIDGNDEKHQVEKHYKVACIACGEILDDDLEELTTEEHTFDQDEKCTVCGYEKECSHTWTLDSSEYSCKMISGNEQQHETISVSWKECRACGEVVGEKTEVRNYEYHSFDELGWCADCGYQMSDQPTENPMEG